MLMPSFVFPEMTFPAPEEVPPIVAPDNPTKMPPPALANAVVPAWSMPIRLPSIRHGAPMAMPPFVFPEMRLPAPAEVPPIVAPRIP